MVNSIIESACNKMEEHGIRLKINNKRISSLSIFEQYKNTFLYDKESLSIVRKYRGLRRIDFRIPYLGETLNKIKEEFKTYSKNSSEEIFKTTFPGRGGLNCVSASMLIYLIAKEKAKIEGVLLFIDKEGLLGEREFHFMLKINGIMMDPINPFVPSPRKYVVMDIKEAFYYAFICNVFSANLLTYKEKKELYKFLEDKLGLIAYTLESSKAEISKDMKEKSRMFQEKYLLVAKQ